MLIGVVGPDPCKRSQEKRWNLTCKADNPQGESRMGEPVSKPDLGHLLNPGADEGQSLSDKEEKIITVPQRAKDGVHHRLLIFFVATAIGKTIRHSGESYRWWIILSRQ